MTTTSGRSPELAADVIAERISQFLTERTRIDWEPDTDLFDSGGVSSLFALELVAFLEVAFDIEIVGRDLRQDNFRSIRVMTGLVQRLRE